MQTLTTAPAMANENPTTEALVVAGLVKRYPAPGGGTVAAVDGIDLTVHVGEIFGILGPNGAGKTTTLEIVEGLTRADSGRVRVLGLDPATETNSVQQRIGVQLQSSAYFEFLRLGELLELFGSFYERHLDADELLGRVGLTAKAAALVGELSGGQAQRFSIVAALVNDPEVVFLDEPTTGLDPQARRGVWEVIRQLADEGRTVILTTHYMEEAEVLADRIAVIDHGQIAAVDTPTALMDRYGTGTTVSFTTAELVDVGALGALPAVTGVRTRRNGVATHELAVDAPDIAVAALYQWADVAGVEMRDVSIRRSTLEDVFLNLTGSRLRD
jgi:ABC-2 type transport system ATP-binding protein